MPLFRNNYITFRTCLGTILNTGLFTLFELFPTLVDYLLWCIVSQSVWIWLSVLLLLIGFTCFLEHFFLRIIHIICWAAHGEISFLVPYCSTCCRFEVLSGQHMSIIALGGYSPTACIVTSQIRFSNVPWQFHSDEVSSVHSSGALSCYF